MKNSRSEIFGTFQPLTKFQMRRNVITVSSYAATFLIIIVGMVFAVWSGNVWIGVSAAVIWICAVMYVASIRTLQYVPKFGKKYNLMRTLICGCLVYGGIAWRGLLGLYNHLCLDISLSAFGWLVLCCSLFIAVISKLSLYRIVDVQIADFVGIVEVIEVGIFIGSIMFLLLYT